MDSDNTGIIKIIAIFLTVVLSTLSLTWVFEVDSFAAERDSFVTLYHQTNAEYWYRITLEYDSEIYTPILVDSGTSSLGNQLYSMGAVVGTVVTIEGNMSWNFVEGQEVTWIWAFDSIVQATNKIMHEDGTTMYNPSDYTFPTVTHEWLLADETLRVVTSNAGVDIDSIGMTFFQWEDYDNGILSHQFGLTGIPDGNWDYISTDGYIFDMDTTVDISLYDDGQLIDVIYYDVIRGINVETGAQLNFDDNFIFNYFEDYVEIISLEQSYENIRVALSRVNGMGNPVPMTTVESQAEVMNLEYNEPSNFVYQSDLEFGTRYELTLFKKDLFGFYTEVLYHTVFEYGYTRSNANPSSYYTYDEVIEDIAGVDWTSITEDFNELKEFASGGVQFMSNSFQILPYPFNLGAIILGFMVILALVFKWILGRG